jgi:hypothetical protein
MPSTKKLVPFDLATAIEKGNVKLADGRPVTIITYENPEPEPILGYYQTGSRRNFSAWRADGTLVDDLGLDNIELRLEVDDFDFFPKNKGDGFASDLEAQIKALRVDGDLKRRDIDELRKERDDYRDQVLAAEKSRDMMSDELDIVRKKLEEERKKIRALSDAREAWLNALSVLR